MQRLVIYAICSLLLTITAANAGQIRILIFGDTSDASIGDGIAFNVSRISTLARELKADGFADTATKVIGDDFSCAAIRKALRAVPVESDDAVFIYYAGHGYRDKPYPNPEKPQADESDPADSKFPIFECRRSRDADDAPLSMAEAVRLILDRKPRFILAVADACNVLIPQIAPPGQGGVNLAETRRKGFQRLFFEYQGSLLMSGSMPGEYSWYLNAGTEKGGFFTRQLLTALDHQIAAAGGNVAWSGVATDAVKKIEIPEAQPEPQVQSPQAELNVELVQR